MNPEQLNNMELLAGNYEMAIGSTVIPAQLLGDITPDFQEGELSVTSQAGVRTRGSGKPETAQLTYTLFLPAAGAAELLGQIWPEAYTAPTAEAQKTGHLWFGGGACKTKTPQPINIHNICESTDDNDLYFPATTSKIAFNPSLSTSEVTSLEITTYVNPDSEGRYVRFGTGDLTQPSKYDPTTQKTVPVTAGD